MTEQRLKELNKANDGIKRIDDIIKETRHCWNRGYLRVFHRKLKFSTEYGLSGRTIELEQDEVEAFIEYMQTKRQKLQSILSEEDKHQ